MITDPAALPPLREVIARHGIAARRSLGQNFILDLNVTRRIARAAGPLDTGTVGNTATTNAEGTWAYTAP